MIFILSLVRMPGRVLSILLCRANKLRLNDLAVMTVKLRIAGVAMVLWGLRALGLVFE